MWLYCIYLIWIRSISSGAMCVKSCLSEYPQKAKWKDTNPRRAGCCLQYYLCHCAACGYVKVRGHCSGVSDTGLHVPNWAMLTVSARVFIYIYFRWKSNFNETLLSLGIFERNYVCHHKRTDVAELSQSHLSEMVQPPSFTPCHRNAARGCLWHCTA